MSSISLVVIVDKEWGIGKNNQLLCHLPADLKHFKTVTMGKPIVMGRKTFQSIGKALPGRVNIILSRHHFVAPNVSIVDSLQSALDIVKDSPEVMIIGGGMIFQQALSIANCIYLTKIHAHLNADVFFPKLNPQDWICEDKEHREQDIDNPYAMTFYRYVRRDVKNQ